MTFVILVNQSTAANTINPVFLLQYESRNDCDVKCTTQPAQVSSVSTGEINVLHSALHQPPSLLLKHYIYFFLFLLLLLSTMYIYSYFCSSSIFVCR